MSILFFNNKNQEIAFNASKNSEEKKRGVRIHTEINPLSNFYLAETYHQKYYLQQKESLVNEYLSFYPDAKDFINSTSAARVNGYVRGEGTTSGLKEEIDLLGLTEKGKGILTDIVKGFGK